MDGLSAAKAFVSLVTPFLDRSLFSFPVCFFLSIVIWGRFTVLSLFLFYPPGFTFSLLFNQGDFPLPFSSLATFSIRSPQAFLRFSCSGLFLRDGFWRYPGISLLLYHSSAPHPPRCMGHFLLVFPQPPFPSTFFSPPVPFPRPPGYAQLVLGTFLKISPRVANSF